MALGAATPDRARLLRTSRSGARVAGRYVTAQAYSRPFRCRFTEQGESEGRSQSGVRRVKPAQLMVAKGALSSRGIAALGPSDRIEITPAGAAAPVLFEIQGAPRPIRKRRTVIGWIATLQKVRDSE